MLATCSRGLRPLCIIISSAFYKLYRGLRIEFSHCDMQFVHNVGIDWKVADDEGRRALQAPVPA